MEQPVKCESGLPVSWQCWGSINLLILITTLGWCKTVALGIWVKDIWEFSVLQLWNYFKSKKKKNLNSNRLFLDKKKFHFKNQVWWCSIAGELLLERGKTVLFGPYLLANDGLMLMPNLQHFGHLMRRANWERLRVGGEGATQDEIVGCHHCLGGHEFDWALGDSEGQGSLAWCKELDMT